MSIVFVETVVFVASVGAIRTPGTALCIESRLVASDTVTVLSWMIPAVFVIVPVSNEFVPTENAPPTLRFRDTATPPENTAAPFVEFKESVEFVKVTIPPIDAVPASVKLPPQLILPPVPIPPVTTKAPLVVALLAVAFVTVTIPLAVIAAVLLAPTTRNVVPTQTPFAAAIPPRETILPRLDAVASVTFENVATPTKLLVDDNVTAPVNAPVPPTFNAPPTPTPPDMTAAPVVVFDDVVVFKSDKIPDILTPPVNVPVVPTLSALVIATPPDVTILAEVNDVASVALVLVIIPANPAFPVKELVVATESSAPRYVPPVIPTPPANSAEPVVGLVLGVAFELT